MRLPALNFRRAALVALALSGACTTRSNEYALGIENAHTRCGVTVTHSGDPAGNVTISPGDSHTVPLTNGEHRLTALVSDDCRFLISSGPNTPTLYSTPDDTNSIVCEYVADQPEEEALRSSVWKSRFEVAEFARIPQDLRPDDGIDYDAGSSVTEDFSTFENFVVVLCPHLKTTFYEAF